MARGVRLNLGTKAFRFPARACTGAVEAAAIMQTVWPIFPKLDEKRFDAPTMPMRRADNGPPFKADF